MTMNFLLIEPNEVTEDSNRIRIAGRRRRHVGDILGAKIGDTLRVGIIGGLLGTARIIGLDGEAVSLEVETDRAPTAKRALTLVLALPRPPVFRRLVSTIASLGVERLLVVGTARTEKSFWQSHVIAPKEVRERLLLGLEQAGDTILPEVEFHRYFEPLLADVLPRCLEGRRGLLAHPGSATPCPHAIDEPAIIFVGPEGGLVDYEVESLAAIGFEPVHLGPRVLRVEPVIPLILGRLFD